jgi:lactoylglutathione lyase
MKIEHIAIWTKNLEVMKDFYCQYFNGKANNKYINKIKQFESYFISFDTGCRIEIMTKSELEDKLSIMTGFAHLAFSVGSKEEVDSLTALLEDQGYKTSLPRITGDGYYESNIEDPDGNIIEITV